MIYLVDKKEEGVVLITSLLFLFVVTILAVTSLQSPRTDIMISGNEQFLDHSQQMANMGVMEAKTWLSVRHRPKSVPLNYKLSRDDLFVVALKGQDSVMEPLLSTNFSRYGTSKSVATTSIAGESIPAFSSSSNNGFYDVRVNSERMGKYKWSIIRITDLNRIPGEATGNDFNDYMSTVASNSVGGRAASQSLISKFSTKKQISKGWDAALDRDRAVLQYFYILSEGHSGPSDSIISNSESIVGYRQIIPDNS